MTCRFATTWLCLYLLSLPIFAQDKSSSSDQRQILQQILTQTYLPSEVGKHLMGIGSETDVRKPGIIVVVQREGLYGSLNRSEIASSTIHDSEATLYRGHKDYPIPVGERFYVIIVTVSSSAVNFGLLSARPVITAQGGGRVWAATTFNFPEATLANADKDVVIREIDRWFVPEGRNSLNTPPTIAVNSPTVAPVAAPVPASVAVPEPQPVSATQLNPGMTRDQVVAVLGKPQREVNFQGQTWLHYPGLAVLLKDGKLDSVDQSAPSVASVTLHSDPPGAEIYLDGQLIGSTPSTLQVPAGNHQLSLKLSGYQDWVRDVRVLAGSEVNFAPKLAKM
jgi:PEGA domain/SmpA / OmlA family